MKLIRTVTQDEVFEHWKKHDTNDNEIVRNRTKYNFVWGLYKVQKKDIERLYIIYAADWTLDYFLTLKDCKYSEDGKTLISATGSNKLETIYENYCKLLKKDNVRALEILVRREAIKKKEAETKLVFISKDGSLDYVCVEGNRRLIALHDLNKLVGSEHYVGMGDTSNFPWYYTGEIEFKANDLNLDHYHWMWTDGINHDPWDKKESWEDFYGRNHIHKNWTLIKYKRAHGPQVDFKSVNLKTE